MKIIIDSDILISHFRKGEETALLDQLAKRSLWFMSSVVAMELRAGCRTRAEVRWLQKFFDPFERTQRVVYPNHRTWMRAGSMLADLDTRGRLNRATRQSLVHDTLIALGAVSIGACVVTANRRDFEMLARVCPLTWFGSVPAALAALSAPKT